MTLLSTRQWKRRLEDLAHPLLRLSRKKTTRSGHRPAISFPRDVSARPIGHSDARHCTHFRNERPKLSMSAGRSLIGDNSVASSPVRLQRRPLDTGWKERKRERKRGIWAKRQEGKREEVTRSEEREGERESAREARTRATRVVGGQGIEDEQRC